MSTDIYNLRSDGMAAKNDALRAAFFIDGTRCFLLKKGYKTTQFEVVAEVVSGYDVKWIEYRDQMRFRLADTDTAWTDRIAQTSYVAFGVPDAQQKLEVFAISADQRDRVRPDGRSVYWKLYGVRKPEMRFTIEEV